MKIGDRVYVHGHVDEIRKDTVIIRNEGGFFGTDPSEVITEPEPHWIPCSERLPEKEVDVLCCRNNKTVAIMHFNPVLTTRYPKGFSVIKNDFSWRQDNVVAWQPLPEPYQPEEESYGSNN